MPWNQHIRNTWDFPHISKLIVKILSERKYLVMMIFEVLVVCNEYKRIWYSLICLIWQWPWKYSWKPENHLKLAIVKFSIYKVLNQLLRLLSSLWLYQGGVKQLFKIFPFCSNWRGSSVVGERALELEQKFTISNEKKY